ncbi:hypothetical protein KR222_009472 [Zaprionus bogoriensis]|nr:hypothetical protein KR222_009472 [Zaprionus bogoriensis]
MAAKYTPNVQELLPVRQYRCEHCSNQVFGNQSHYQLHLRKRHNLHSVSKQQAGAAYHCPVASCSYHAERQNGRGFTSLRLLRQHYQKIHMVKQHKCGECSETFLLPHQLERHKCCASYECAECGLSYGSKASLQTHMRRKNHSEASKQPEPEPEPKGQPLSPAKIALPSLKQWKQQQQQQQQRLQPAKPQPPAYALPEVVIPYTTQQQEQQQTTLDALQLQQAASEEHHDLPALPNFTAEEVERLLRDMETQTDDVDLDTLDMQHEMLAPLLRDIQTQTLDNRQHQGTMTELDEEDRQYASDYQQPEQEQIFGLQTSAHMHTQTCDELFEELGLSHIQTQTHCADGLYNTQHTQTCDEMLDELLENFQSTCTQTRWLDWKESEGAGS